MKGIEPSSQPWEGHILPLNHTRISNAENFYQRSTRKATSLFLFLFRRRLRLRLFVGRRAFQQFREIVAGVVDALQPAVAFRGEHPARAGGGRQGGDGFVHLFERAGEKAGEMGDGGAFDLVVGAGGDFSPRGGPGLGEFHVGQLHAQAQAPAAVEFNPGRQVVCLADGDADGEGEKAESFDGLGRRRARDDLAAHAVNCLRRMQLDLGEHGHEEQLLLENRQLEGGQFAQVLFFRRGEKKRTAGRADHAELLRRRVNPQFLPVPSERERFLLDRGGKQQAVGGLEGQPRLLPDEVLGQSSGLGDNDAGGKGLRRRSGRRLDHLGDFQERGGKDFPGRGGVGFLGAGRQQRREPDEKQKGQVDFYELNGAFLSLIPPKGRATSGGVEFERSAAVSRVRRDQRPHLDLLRLVEDDTAALLADPDTTGHRAA